MKQTPRVRAILLPTAFDELSIKAASMACMLAREHGATLHVLHICQTMPVAIGPMMADTVAMSETTAEDELEQARRELAGFIQKEIAPAGLAVEAVTRLGSPVYAAIVQYASEASIDLIVIGSHGGGLLHRMFFGSVSEALLEHAHCPVLVVPNLLMEPVHEELQMDIGKGFTAASHEI